MYKCTDNVKEEILNTLGKNYHETGGLLGSTQPGLIDHFAFDNVFCCTEKGRYTPDVAFLNNILTDWHDKNISFVGLIHSPEDRETLSEADIKYEVQVIRLNAIESMIMGLYIQATRKIVLFKITSDGGATQIR